MAHQPWLDEIEQRLCESRLPQSYIRRFMDELADHVQDIMEDRMNKESKVFSQLGEPGEVANAAILAYERRTFFGRHPSAKFWVFAVSPAGMLIGLFLLAFGCMYGGFAIYDRLGINLNVKRFDPIASAVLPYVFSLLMVVFPSILAVVFYCKVAERYGIGKLWVGLSCLLMSLLAMIPIWSITLSDLPNQSVLKCGVMLMPQSFGQFAEQIAWYLCRAQQLFQLTMPLLLGFWLLHRSDKQKPQEERLRMAA